MSMNRRTSNTLWIEKHRPIDLSTYVADQAFKDRVQKYIDENDIPHILLSGKAGTGKTTVAKIIAYTMKCDVLYINASKENNVDIVRNKIHNFATSMGFHDLKLVVLDECDYLSLSAQASLRGVMEENSMSTRFILTCNYPEKMMEAIVSRCQHFKLYPPSKKDVAQHMITIFDSENITYTIEDLKFLIDSFYPDIRKILGESQSWSTEGVLKIDKKKLVENDYRLKVMEIFKSSDNVTQKLTSIRQLLTNTGIKDFSDMYRLLFDNVDKLFPKSIPESITILNEGQYKDALVLDKEINAMATLLGLLTLD